MPLIVFITAPRGKGREVARRLVEKRLAACASVTGVESVYWWEGRVEEAGEDLIIAKTCEEAYPALEAEVKSMGYYEVPEVLAVPVVRGLGAYVEWLCREVEARGSGAGGGGKS